jgi:hypothetical protein
MITPYSDWPHWLQLVVVIPNGLLAGFMMWVWWPKSNRGWNRFGWLAAYLLIFWFVMFFVFHIR